MYISISKSNLILSFQKAAEVERDRLKSINLALQQRLADYLHKRKVIFLTFFFLSIIVY